jgi:hypothetical protein
VNIDLLLTGQNEPGLVSDESFDEPVAGVMYDAETGLLTLEFGEGDPVELNIPVGSDTGRSLLNILEIQIGVIERGMIAENRQVPLVLINDPFGGGNSGRFPVKPRNSSLSFESFMQRCTSGQPVHRDDLGDERHAGSILGSVSPAVLQFAPHLARQKAMEATPHLAPAPSAPGMTPGGGGGSTTVRRIQKPASPVKKETDED